MCIQLEEDIRTEDCREGGMPMVSGLLESVLAMEEATKDTALNQETAYTDEEWESEGGVVAKDEEDKTLEMMSPEDVLNQLQYATRMQAEESDCDDEDELTMVFDPLTMETTVKGLRLVFGTERVVDGSGNVEYRLKVTDTGTKAVATGSLASCNAMVKELSRCGNTYVIDPLGQNEFFEAAKFEIENVTCHQNSELQHGHNILGWTNPSESTEIVKYCGNNIVDGDSLEIIESKYKGSAVKMVQSGSLDEWLNAVNTHVESKPILSCVLASSVSGILRQRYEKLSRDTNIILGLVGETSCGKTTAIRIANTVHTTGNAITTSNATINALTKRFASRPVIPATIDEAKLMSGVRTGRQSETFNMLMTLASGESRDRLAKDGNQQELGKYYAPVYLTSTQSLLFTSGSDEGQAQRIIEFKIESGDLTDDDRQARKAEQEFENNCGWCAEAFALELLKQEYDCGSKEAYESFLIEEFMTIKESLLPRMMMPRMANRAAMILLCAQLMNDLLGTYFDLKAIENVLIDRCNFIRKQFVERPKALDAQNAATNLAEYYLENKQHFLAERPSSRSELEESLGIAKENQTGVVLQFYDDTILSKALYGVDANVILGLQDTDHNILIGEIDNVLKWWREQGILIHCMDHPYTKKATMVRGEKQEYIYEVFLQQRIVDEARNRIGGNCNA